MNSIWQGYDKETFFDNTIWVSDERLEIIDNFRMWLVKWFVVCMVMSTISEATTSQLSCLLVYPVGQDILGNVYMEMLGKFYLVNCIVLKLIFFHNY